MITQRQAKEKSKVRDLKRYHFQVYFEPNIVNDIKAFLKEMPYEIHHSPHSKEETYKDRYTIIPDITREQLLNSYLIEYYRSECGIEKAVFRVVDLSERFNYVYVINRFGTVVTNWANEADDTHFTLNRNLYEQGEANDK